MLAPAPITAVLKEAIGRGHRDNVVVRSSGGPAGNTRLIAWTGLSLLVLILAQLVTLLDVSGLISWHVVIGMLLVGLTLLKTASVVWRMARYYAGCSAYRAAGAPPTLLRWLGPFVAVTALGLLGSGLALIALGPRSSRRPLVSVLGLELDAVTLHQVLFFAFAAAVGLHVIARLIPAVTTLAGRAQRTQAVPGGLRRIAVVLVVLGVGALVGSFVLGPARSWRRDYQHYRQVSVRPVNSTPLRLRR